MRRGGDDQRTVSRPGLVFLLLLLLITSASQAGDPWKDKSYKEWTMEEVEKILSDSPWAKTVNVEAPWIKGAPHFLTGMQAGCGGRPDVSKPVKTPPQMATGFMSDSIVAFQAVWQSSYTIRAARLRMALLSNRTDPEEADEVLERELDGYYITVSAPDMSPFDGMSNDSLIFSASLLIKSKNQRISPTDVRVMRGMDQRTVFSLTFKFPKKTDNGEPLIAPDEKEVDFVVQSGKTAVKARFQPAKMTNQKGADV